MGVLKKNEDNEKDRSIKPMPQSDKNCNIFKKVKETIEGYSNRFRSSPEKNKNEKEKKLSDKTKYSLSGEIKDRSDEQRSPESALEIEDSCVTEIDKCRNNLGRFMCITDAIITGKRYKDEEINCLSLCQNWRVVLEISGCKKLLAAYDDLAEKYNMDFVYVDENAAEEFLKNWIKFFNEFGVYQYKDKTLNEDGNVVITRENRAYYENGKLFADGSVCKVVETAWVLKNGDIYFCGKLEAIEEKTSDSWIIFLFEQEQNESASQAAPEASENDQEWEANKNE